MPLEWDTYTRYNAVVANGLHNKDHLSDWQIDFLGNIANKLIKYRRGAYISDKEEAKLVEIEEILMDELGDDYAKD